MKTIEELEAENTKLKNEVAELQEKISAILYRADEALGYELDVSDLDL